MVTRDTGIGKGLFGMLRAICIAAAALTIGQSAQAATVTFNNLASYDAALGPSTVAETFTGNTLNGTAISQILGSQALTNNRLQSVAGLPTGLQYTTLVFSTAMTSFAAKIGSLGIGEFANVLLDGVLVTTLGNRATFFGLHSTKSFTSITFVDGTLPRRNTQFNIDDIRVAAVPVAAGMPLLVGGLGMLFGIGRRKRRTA